MNGRIRQLADRPFDERERNQAFAGVAALLLAAALALTVTAPTVHHQPEPLQAVGDRHPAASPSTAIRARLGSERQRVSAVANRFLAGYLADLYGHAPAHAIRASDPALRRRLAATVPQMSAAARRRDPQVKRLSTRPLSGGWFVRAVISDGDVADYPVELVVERRRGRLVVVRLVGD